MTKAHWLLTLIVALALTLGVAFAPMTTQAAEKLPMQALDLFDLRWVTDPQISPNGKQVTYVQRSFDVMEDRANHVIWTMNTDGSRHEPLTNSTSSSSSPRWSGDGQRLAYVSNAEGSSQIHVRWLNSNHDIAITELMHSPRSLAWSPDGEYIAFIQFVPGENKPIATLPTKPEGAKWNDAPRVFEDLYYRSDSGGFVKPGFNQLFVVSSSGGKPIQLTDESYQHGGTLAWAADGKHLYFSANYQDNWQLDRTESDLYRVAIESHEVTRITERDGPDTRPAVSPDGKWIAYTGADDAGKYQNQHIYLASLNEAWAPSVLIDVDRPITAIQWASSSKNIYFSYVDEAITRVARTGLKGKRVEVSEGLGGTAIGRPYARGRFSVADNGTLAFEKGDSRQPANLGLKRGNSTQQLTNLNRDLLAIRDIQDVEEIRFASSHDDLEIQGWIVKPPGFDPAKKYPLILEIHGGPHTAYGDEFSAEVQLYAAAGYVVLYTNPRGSTSYGEDFALEIYQDYPGYDYDDLISGVDAVIAQGYIDSDNLFVTGGSGGGILTAWIVTKTDRFRAAVSQKPVINWFTLTLTSDIGSFFWNNFFKVEPWVDPAAYLAKSPIAFVGKVTTPTMLLTGEQDWRTPMSESEQFYQGLQMNGVESALVRIQNSGHSIAAKPSNLLAKVSYVLGWFDRYRTDKE